MKNQDKQHNRCEAMNEDELTELLRERLKIRVTTKSNYTGGMNGSGNMYSDSHTIELLLDDEVISSADL